MVVDIYGRVVYVYL